MSIETIKCPKCGENATVDTDRDFGFCSYCGFKIEKQKPEPIPAEAPTADSLLTRAQFFLEENNYEKADEYFNKVLDINPYTSMAYMGLLIIKTNALDFDKLSKKPQPIEEMSEFKNAVRFAENEEAKQRYIELAQEKQAELDRRWNERQNVIAAKQQKEDIRHKEDIRASIKRLNTLITFVEIVKALHALIAAIGIIAILFLFLATLADIESIVILIPVIFATGFIVGGVIGLDKLSDGLAKIVNARKDTLEYTEE